MLSRFAPRATPCIFPSRFLSSTPHAARTTTTTSAGGPTTTTTTSAARSLPIDSLPRYPTLSPAGSLRLLDYIGTLSFAHTGALLAATSGMDLLGTCVVGTITAVGGGTIRDAIILAKRPFWTSEIEYLYLCLAASGLTFALWPRGRDDDSPLHFATDALGVAAFSVIGAQNGVRAGMGGLVCVICGMATATFGGAVRDVLCNRKVRILHSQAEVYASTAAAGAASYLVARGMGARVGGRVGAGLAVAFAGRSYAWMYGTRLPVWTQDEEADAEVVVVEKKGNA